MAPQSKQKKGTRGSQRTTAGPPPVSAGQSSTLRPTAQPTRKVTAAPKQKKTQKKTTKTVLSTVARRDHSPNVPDDERAPSEPSLSAARPDRTDTAFAEQDDASNPASAGLAVAAQAKANADAEKIRELVNLVRERDEQVAESQREANQSRTMAEEASGESPLLPPGVVLVGQRLTVVWAEAQLNIVQHTQVNRLSVRRMRRATIQDDWTDAPMKDILGLGVAGLDKTADAVLIARRNTLYKWVLATTQRVVYDGHSAKKADHRIEFRAAWGSIGTVKQKYLLKRYRARVLGIPEMVPVFFFPTPAGSIVDAQTPAHLVRSIFDDDWPMQVMLRDHMKNERSVYSYAGCSVQDNRALFILLIYTLLLCVRDGRRNTESWRKMLKEDAELMRPTDRPLVGNSVVRIWRDSRLPHTLSKSQSDIWDIRPEASSDSTSRLASATVSRNQGEVGGVDGVRVITPVIERGNGTSGTESGGEPQSDNGSGGDSEEESQDEGSISQSGAMDEGDEEDST
ncbi:hypothetical protein QFC22_001885 [Naganishia vaughanmartiniae]|uniref:Uncharacterized protein n=1 Tax=Naganishia vaughanmartiniae TaxID=1424756 RepID=A0ACC2XGE3_9TREE|nr:hypothetical protein QFC22_001885 [Naganishia vaughanmartiniae]